MEKIDFRPPIIKNIGAAFGSSITIMSAVSLLLAAAVGLISLPLNPILLGVFAVFVITAMLLFALYSASKDKQGMRRGALLFLTLLSVLLTVLVLAVIVVFLFFPYVLPTKLFFKMLAAAYIGEAYQKWVILAVLCLMAVTYFSFALYFSAVRRTLKDGIPRYRGTWVVCVLNLTTSSIVSYVAVMYTLGQSFSSIIDFSKLLSYNFISALSPLFYFLSTAFVFVTLIKYSNAVKRSTNV